MVIKKKNQIKKITRSSPRKTSRKSIREKSGSRLASKRKLSVKKSISQRMRGDETKKKPTSSSPSRESPGNMRSQTGSSAKFFFAENPVDKVLLTLVLMLVFFGVMMVASAGVIYADTVFDDPNFFIKRQLIGVGIGLFVMTVLSFVNYHVYRRWAFVIFLAAIALLIAVLIPSVGQEVYGARRWIYLGSVSFQPAEAVKLAMILYISAWCAAKGYKRISDTKEGFIPFMLIVGAASGLIIAQPDVGTMGMIAIIAMSIFYLAGSQYKHLGLMVLMGIGLLGVLIKMAPYRMARLLTFLDPESDALDSGYQISQAAIAIGSGGLWGLGLGHSRQKALFLPEPVGDSIFAIIAEEFGLLGSLGLIAAFALLGYRIYCVARGAQDLFGRLVAAGIGVWFVAQAFINMGAISGIMPLTGIPLTFISYGGTSIVFVLAAVGILLNISRQQNRPL